jgi:hypothetical protein
MHVVPLKPGEDARRTAEAKAAEDARRAAEAQKPPRTGNTKKPKPTKAHITPRKEKLSRTRAAR